jgi:hypothetical protein
VATPSHTLRKEVVRFEKPAIIGKRIGAAAVNAFAFAARTKNLGMTWCCRKSSAVRRPR